MAELPLDLPVESKIVLDAAYTYFEWEDDLLEQEQTKLLVQRKHNSRRADLPAIRWKLQNLQKLKAGNPDKHREQHETLKKILDSL